MLHLFHIIIILLLFASCQLHHRFGLHLVNCTTDLVCILSTAPPIWFAWWSRQLFGILLCFLTPCSSMSSQWANVSSIDHDAQENPAVHVPRFILSIHMSILLWEMHRSSAGLLLCINSFCLFVLLLHSLLIGCFDTFQTAFYVKNMFVFFTCGLSF